LRLVLLVDNSGSTRKNGDVIHKDLLGLADFAKTSLRAEDRAAVITFAEDIFMDQDFTSETGKLEKAIHSIRDGVGGTALSDALVASTHHLARRTQAEARSVQRAIILITDGEDNNSKTRLSDAIRTIQSSSVPVFGVKTSSHTRNGEEYMRTTTTETGGLLFDSQKPQQMAETFNRIAELLRTRYIATYSPGVGGGSFRRFDVRINGHGAAMVVAASGHQVP